MFSGRLERNHHRSHGGAKHSQPVNHAHQGEIETMKHSVKALVLTAAVTGLLSGTTTRVQAQTSPANSNSKTSVSQDNSKAGVKLINGQTDDKTKHSCKGKNDCKGQGGCKSSANGCKGKNDCKGKGGCATDGSKPPSVA
jgi:hypothetical protein